MKPQRTQRTQSGPMASAHAPLRSSSYSAVNIVVFLTVIGCSRVETVEKADDAIVQERERGPVKVTLRVEPKEPTFADRVKLTIHAVAKKGVELTLPLPGENLGEFIIKDFDAPPEVVTADSTERRQSYVLEFLTSGEYKIPPLTVSFKDRRPSESEPAEIESPPATEPAPGTEPPPEAEREFKLLTDEIAITVKPLPDAEKLKDLASISAQAEPPPGPVSLLWLYGGAGAAVAIGALAYVVLSLIRRPKPAAPPVPAHERAYQDLEWLLGQGFIDRGELKEFFFHLSRILREYIEARFGLRAPESTTEEFLDEIGGRRDSGGLHSGSPRAAGAIPAAHVRLLRDFLERADLVKFAKYLPEKSEIEESFDAAKRFVEETRIEEKRIERRPPAQERPSLQGAQTA